MVGKSSRNVEPAGYYCPTLSLRPRNKRPIRMGWRGASSSPGAGGGDAGVSGRLERHDAWPQSFIRSARLIGFVSHRQYIALRVLEPGCMVLPHGRNPVDGLQAGHVIIFELHPMPTQILHLGLDVIGGERQQGIGRLAGVGRGVKQEAGASPDPVDAACFILHRRGQAELVAIPRFCPVHVCSRDGRVGTMICEHDFPPFQKLRRRQNTPLQSRCKCDHDVQTGHNACADLTLTARNGHAAAHLARALFPGVFS